MPYKLILNKGLDEQTSEHDSMEAAFDAGTPLLYDGYILRGADDAGVVQYTQVMDKGRIAVFRGDATSDRQNAPPVDPAQTASNGALKLAISIIGFIVFYVALQVAEAYFKG